MVSCHFLKKLENLLSCFRIEGTGGLIRKKHRWSVDQCAGYCNPLHLSSGELVGFLVGLIQKSHPVQCIECALSSFLLAYARKRHCKLHVRKHALMRDEVVALENETYGVVSVGIPVAGRITACRHTIDEHFTAVVVIQATDDIQKRSLAGSAGTQHCHEFGIPE